MIRTFLDTGVLITLGRASGPSFTQAARLIADLERTFVVSPFVELELLPGPIRSNRKAETAFYQRFLERADRVNDLGAILTSTYQALLQSPMELADALHVAAAYVGECDELVTTEKRGKPMFRTDMMRVVSIA